MVRDGRCIFHLEGWLKAEIDQFEKEFQEEIARLEQNSDRIIDLTGFTFPIPLSLVGHVFPKPIRFSGAEFFGEVNLSKATFKGITHLNAFFKQEACFSNTTFEGEADFIGARFEGKADFEYAKFRGKASLGAWFDKETVFSYATFEKEAYFGTTFEKEAYFTGATFKGKVDFYATKFEDRAGFNTATFEGEADFSNVRFGKIAKFRWVTFLKPKSVVFDLNDLSNVSFLQTENVAQVSFREVKWNMSGKRYKLIDENEIGKMGAEATYDNVADVYRRLRRNYESKLRYAEAGEFFKSEMEMKRMAIAPDEPQHLTSKRALNWLRRNFSAIALYKLLSMYGESWKRVAIWIAISIPLFASVRTLPFLALGADFSQFVGALYENFKRGVFVFFQLRSDDLLDVIERVWSGLLLGLALIALRRQLERHR